MQEQHQKTWMVNFICILVILGVFSISGLVLANVGVRVYKNIVIDNAENFKLRTSLSYVATKIRQTDSLGNISVEERDGVALLVLDEEIQGVSYETLIYYYKENLYELFQRKDSEFEISYGMQVMEIDEFTIEEITDSTLKITAGNGNGEIETLLMNIRTRR